MSIIRNASDQLYRIPPLAIRLAVSGKAFAADIVWINTPGGNWNVPANWSPNAVPGVGD